MQKLLQVYGHWSGKCRTLLCYVGSLCLRFVLEEQMLYPLPNQANYVSHLLCIHCIRPDLKSTDVPVLGQPALGSRSQDRP